MNATGLPSTSRACHNLNNAHALYDVFLSHASADKPAVERFPRRVRPPAV